MNFDEMVRYIREDGCRVYVYPNKKTIFGGNSGTFSYNEHGPIIAMASSGRSKYKRMETLLHEYGHFLQYKDGFMQYLDDICDSYEIERIWLAGKVKLTPMELLIARNCMLTMEYDAERRAVQTAEELDVEDFCRDYYVKGAAGYAAAIKWTWARKINTTSTPARKLFSSNLLTNEELFAPLTEDELKKFDKALKPSRYPTVK